MKSNRKLSSASSNIKFLPYELKSYYIVWKSEVYTPNYNGYNVVRFYSRVSCLPSTWSIV